MTGSRTQLEMPMAKRPVGPDLTGGSRSCGGAVHISSGRPIRLPPRRAAVEDRRGADRARRGSALEARRVLSTEPGLSCTAVSPERGSIVRSESCVRACEAQARRALRRLERHRVGNPIDHGDRRWTEGVGVLAAQPGLPARTRRTTWNLQECFSPRAMRPIGSDFRRARSSAIGGRAKVRCFTALAGTCAICRRTLKPGPKRGGARRLETRETPVGRRHDGTSADRRGGRPGTGKAQGGLCGRPTAGLVAAMLGLPAHAGRVARRAQDARIEGMGSPRVNRPGMQRCGVRVEART